ncbi:MAG: 50S ribosome-binding GTPase [Planctomycetes bacterium]|nr:50S ribosome-binding GTPase [Planctomycetota bacterium]
MPQPAGSKQQSAIPRSSGARLDLTATYVFLATPPGSGGIALVEVIGAGAGALVQRVFRPRAAAAAGPRRRPSPGPSCDPTAAAPVLGDLVDEHGAFDEALLSGPSGPDAVGSFTGLPTATLSCHGGRAPVRKLLRLLETAGALRMDDEGVADLALATGRLDRIGREAWPRLRSARTRLATEVFARALAGELWRATAEARELLRAAAGADHPAAPLERAHVLLARLAAAAPFGLALAFPRRVVLVGPPNAGKSTLFNALLGGTRALVHAEPGTTRDSIEAEAAIRGVPVLLVDTAGLRETPEPVEAAGIEEARRQAAAADLLLDVRDASAAPLPSAPSAPAVPCASPPSVRVLAQWDRVPPGTNPDAGVPVSATRGTGLDALSAAILRALGLPEEPAPAAAPFTPRQAALVRRALARADAALQATTPELARARAARASASLDRLRGPAAAAPERRVLRE